MKKIIVSVLLSAVMITGSVPASIMAADEAEVSEETMSEDSVFEAESVDESANEDSEVPQATQETPVTTEEQVHHQ